MRVNSKVFFQFFPCKICGAKFPSYYFVHKHKKLWHADEEDPETGPEMDDSKTSEAPPKN
jgi:hypothetical protein